MANETEAELKASGQWYAHPTKYALISRRKHEVNTDPQRRCYWGVHAKSEWVWGPWRDQHEYPTEAEAMQSIAEWVNLHRIDNMEHLFEYKCLPPTGTPQGYYANDSRFAHLKEPNDA